MRGKQPALWPPFPSPHPDPLPPPPLRRFLVHRSANERHSNGISTRSLSISLPKHFRSIRSSSKHGTNSSLLPVVTLHLDDNRNLIPSNICNFNLFCFVFILLIVFFDNFFTEIIFIRSKFKFENHFYSRHYIIYINYSKTLNFRKIWKYD